MLFAHLNTFLVFIAFLLFWIRANYLRPSELLLGIFSGIYLLTTSTFLAYQYYNFKAIQFLDLLGVISELFTLLIPIFYIYYLGKNVKVNSVLMRLFFLVAVLTGIHFYLSDKSGFLFYGINAFAESNIKFQIVIDLILFVVFSALYINYNRDNSELFDGEFKWTVGILFISYYIQDIVTLVVLAFFTNLKNINESIFIFGNIMNLLVSYLLIHLAIHTNWLSLWHIIKNESNEQTKSNYLTNKNPLLISTSELSEIRPLEYHALKSNYYSRFPDLFENIDSQLDLSKNEKLYMALSKFDFSHKELANILNVSVRTVETNFYRLRKKKKS